MAAHRRRGHSPRRPEFALELPKPRSGCASRGHEHICKWLVAIKGWLCRLVDPLLGHYAWYSYWLLWLFNGDMISCNITAITEFAKLTGIPARKIHLITRQEDPVQNAVTCWTAKKTERPLLICVSWDPTSNHAAHWLCYCNKQVTHSSCFDGTVTRSGEMLGFAKRIDPVDTWEDFDFFGSKCSRALNCYDHQRMAEAIYKILDSIPEMHHAVDMELVKREIYIRSIHRTQIGDGTPVNLTYSSKDTWP